MRVETDYILSGSPTMAELSSWLEDGHDEHYVIQAIKKHLLTEEQRKILFDLNLDIADLLNGRFVEAHVQMFFIDWNTKLGKKQFGFNI